MIKAPVPWFCDLDVVFLITISDENEFESEIEAKPDADEPEKPVPDDIYDKNCFTWKIEKS